MAKGFKNSVENVFNRIVIYNLIVAVLTIIVGIALLFLPQLSNKLVGAIIGIIFLIEGINSIYKYFNRDGAKLYSFNLIFGILYAILGVIIILYPFKVVEFITVFLGLSIIINGASKINYGVWLKKGNEESWLLTLVTGILLLIIGLLVIFYPFQATLTITKLTGAFLIITGALDFMDTILFRQRRKEIMEIFW